jgi:DNA-binding Lrp family transcriptional regulator
MVAPPWWASSGWRARAGRKMPAFCRVPIYGFRPSYARYATHQTHTFGLRRAFGRAAAQYSFAKQYFAVCMGRQAEKKERFPVSARLDAIDRKILKELQDDGRMTNVELASRVGISAPPCLRRVRALEEAGYIKGYRALLDEKKLGYEVSVFAMVHLASQAEADLMAFEEFVRAQPLVRECWMLSGEIDFVLKCVAPDLKTFQALIEKLTSAPNVRNVKTSLTLRNSKDAAMVPMDGD